MKIKDILYKTPEMTEERLLEILRKYTNFIKGNSRDRIEELYNKRHNEHESDLAKMILDEWDVINEKKSFLSKSQRDEICGLVSICLIEMTKNE